MKKITNKQKLFKLVFILHNSRIKHLIQPIYVLFCTIMCIIFTSLCKFLQSEVKIIHIIVQNNTYYSARSRWTKQQQPIY